MTFPSMRGTEIKAPSWRELASVSETEGANDNPPEAIASFPL